MLRNQLMVVIVGAGLGAVGVSAYAAAAPTKVVVHKIDASGVGAEIGTLTLSDSKQGLRIKASLKGLPPGDHGFHVHENGSCDPGDKDGKPAAGIAAGGHFDPDATHKHEGPAGAGHRGDLPVLHVAANGGATGSVVAPHLKLADVHGKSLMIHAGGDNFSDQPEPLGGGGARIACGTVP